MPADTAPLTWGYVLAAVLFAVLLIAPLLLALYLDSDRHRRGVARLRATRQKGRTR